MGMSKRAKYLLVIWSMAVTVVAVIIYGMATSALWKWFIVPVFGLPTLSLAEAIGIVILLELLTQRQQHKPKDQHIVSYVAQLTWDVFSTPLLLVFIGYVVHQFM